MRSVSELMDLNGRRALITGGAGHIGMTVAETLIELGARVAVLDRDEVACKERVEYLLRIRPGCAISTPCDLSMEDATRRAIRQVLVQMGGLEIVVHCAGYVGTTNVPGWAVSLDRQTVEAWDAAMRVNLTSMLVIFQETLGAFRAAGKGSVILISSIYGMVGPDMRLYQETSMGNPAGYAASKGGLLQLMRYFATVLAPNVRVNAISPGGLKRDQPAPFQERYITRTPLGRMATEEDLKGAIAYLASDLSAYVTGHNLVVDGGWTTW